MRHRAWLALGDPRSALRAAFDVELLVQMARHRAVEHADAVAAADAVLERLARLCAPSQDATVAALRADLRSGGCDVARLLAEAHAVIDEIERLAHACRTGGSDAAASPPA